MGKDWINVNYVRVQEVLQKYKNIKEIRNVLEGCVM